MSTLSRTIKIKAGYPDPLGLSKKASGMNFALFSKHATSVTLCFFENDQLILELPLDNKKNRTKDIWHILIEKLPEKLTYAYKLMGPLMK